MISNESTVQAKEIGDNVTISEYCVIRADVIIGNNVIIHPHVVINNGVRIADGVEIFPGAIIGKQPQLSGVLHHKPQFSDFVEVGKNSTIGPNSIIYYDVKIGSAA